MLHGRVTESAEIERLVAGARAGAGGAVVVRGEAGIGKTALLQHAAAAAHGAVILRCAGCPSESGQPFASLELMLRPVRERFGDLPGLEAGRLRAVCEPRDVGHEDPFRVGRAVLSLLRRIAAERPVLCLVDDAQWLDSASVDVLTFTARRLGSEPIALLAAARDQETFGSSGLPELRPRRLSPDDAAALLHEAGEQLSPPARDRVLAEADGNPLALRLLAAALTPAQRAGRLNPFTFHDGARSVRGTFHAEALAQVAALPSATQTLLLVAAADDTRDTARLSVAAEYLGVTVADLAPAERAGVLEASGMTVAFAHPLVRAAVYHRATSAERRAVHGALADGAGDAHAELRAWHLAAATMGRREDVAAELERAGEWSGDRRAYACYARAAELTADGRTRAHRLTAAARAAGEAGLFGGAADLAAQAARLDAGPLTRAELAQARATVEFECGSPRRAGRALIDGAAPIRGRDPEEALLMLAEAVRCGWHAGDPRLMRDAAGAALTVALPPRSPLASLAPVIAGAVDRADAARTAAGLRRSLPDELGRRLAAACAALADDAHDAASGLVRDCRDVPGRLPYALQLLAQAQIDRGRHREARDTAAEGLRLAGGPHRAGHLTCLLGWLAAVEGDADRCAALVAAGTSHARAEGIPPTVSLGTWALALLDLGHGRHEEALARLEDVPESVPEAGPVMSVVRQASDRVEAAVRCGRPGRAERPLALIERWTGRSPAPVVRAIADRCRAQLGTDEKAERHFMDAAALLHRKGDHPYEEARTELLYGEWLRRARRRAEARKHLSRALRLFVDLGALVWADRATAELGAAGARPAAGREPESCPAGLTHQELQIVRLAASGASNREIAARLFLSPRTVGNHLYRAFPKLGVRTRTELGRLDLGAGAGPVERPVTD